jgi:integrase
MRLQRRITGIPSEELAHSEEKRLLADLSRELNRLENQGAFWEEVIDRWERYKTTFGLDQCTVNTFCDSAQLLRNWTKPWFGRPAQELNRGDGREILRLVTEAGKSPKFVRRLKTTIQRVYEWGIEERLITGVHQSPVYGIDLGKQKETKVPEVLTFSETQDLIAKAEKEKHPWLPIWKGALLTGMRSGELLGLPWSNVETVSEQLADLQSNLPEDERRYGLIRVHRTWNGRTHSFGPTKGGAWRTIPISGELYWFLHRLRKQTGDQELVFPQFDEWKEGQQAQVLRAFCTSEGLKSIKFHALRATFATLLISKGVAPARVMKICGWKDLKTMQFYIRLAGIDEQGATESLHLLGMTITLRSPDPEPADLKAGLDRESEDCETAEDQQALEPVSNLLAFRPQKTAVI